MKTALLNLQLKIANDTDTRNLRDVVKSMALPQGNALEREYTVSTTIVTHIGVSGALVTVVIPSRKVNLNFTIGGTTVNMPGVNWPVVLPCAISSLAMTTDSADTPSNVYIYQAL